MCDAAASSPNVSQLLQQLTAAGVFEWRLQPDVRHCWSPALRRILGVAEEDAALGAADFIRRFVTADDAGRVGQVVRTVSIGGAPADFEFKICRVDESVRTLRVILARGMSGDTGVPILSGVASDETARRELEGDFRRFHDRLTDVARTAALGEMASGIAHELNQPLAAIATFAQAGERMLSRGNSSIEAAEKIFRDIAAQAMRGGDIICQLRSLMRGRSAERSDIDVAAVVRDLQSQFDVMSRAGGVVIRVDAGSAPARVLADPAELQFVTLLLVQNAVEAQREAGVWGQVTVSVALRPPSVEVVVRDTGAGVAQEKRDLLFKPFFTTKAHGTGLGLASGRAVIERYQGSIGFDAPPDGGSRFWFKIPCLLD